MVVKSWMKYRYLDLRRAPLQRNLELRNRVNIEVQVFRSRGFHGY